MSRVLPVALLAALAAAGVLALAAGAAPKEVASSVHFSSVLPGEGGKRALYFGRVSSEDPRCVAARKVRLEIGSGTERKLQDVALTSRNGGWGGWARHPLAADETVHATLLRKSIKRKTKSGERKVVLVCKGARAIK